MSNASSLIGAIRRQDTPLPPTISESLTDFLKAREGKLLGRPAQEVLAQTVDAEMHFTAEEQAEMARTQKHFDGFKLADKGRLAQLLGDFIKLRQPRMGESAAGVLLQCGLAYWYESATIIGRIHQPNVSYGVLRKKVEHSFDLLDEALDYATERTDRLLTQLVNNQLVTEAERLSDLLDTQLSAEREQMTAAADAAQADATQARRERDQLAAQVRELQEKLSKLEYDSQKKERQLQADLRGLPELTAERDALQTQVHRLDAHLKAERGQFVLRERTLTTRVAELEAQVQEMHTRPDPQPTPEVPMPTPAPRPALRPALAALSFVSFVKSQGYAAAVDASSGQFAHQLKKADYLRLDAEWRRAVPDESAAFAQLRAVVRPILHGVA